MSSFSYGAVDPRGWEANGALEVANQDEAVKRIKEMGLFPTKVFEKPKKRLFTRGTSRSAASVDRSARFNFGFDARIKPAHLAVFTRQLATLLQAGMPLLR